ncbi:hypothetical protein FHG87_010168 [Trinorchestia longiramus]|nr:hypothetical protein FHG87_010168 [Trinorchestia longiramus]
MDGCARQNLIKEIKDFAEETSVKKQNPEVKQQLLRVTGELLYELESLPKHKLVYRQLHSDCRVFVPLSGKAAFPSKASRVITDLVLKSPRLQ